MKPKLASLLVGAALALCLCSCASVPGGVAMDPARAQRLAKGAVSVIVLAAVEDHPEKAVQVATIAHEFRGLIGTDGYTTVDLIMAAVEARIVRAGMKPAAQIGVALALGEIGDYLHGAVGTGVIPPDKLALVGEVAGWVEDAAKLVIPPVVVPPPAPVSP